MAVKICSSDQFAGHSSDRRLSDRLVGRPSTSDRLIEWLMSTDKDKLETLCKMHLSFLLDLPGSDLEQLLGDDLAQNCEHNGVERNVFKNLVKKKSKVESKPSENSVFGVPLTMGIINQIAPLITYLNKEENLIQEGLFRKTGNIGRQKCLHEKLDAGEDIEADLSSGEYSAHDCANLLKTFLGELPEPLMTEKHYAAHCQISEMLTEKKQLQSLQLLIHLLPAENIHLLRRLIKLLHRVASHESNLMTPETLGTVFAPHLLVPKKVTPVDLRSKATILIGAVAFMIKNTPLLFKLPDIIVQDIASYWKELNPRSSLKMFTYAQASASKATERKVKFDGAEIKTTLSFTDRQASLQAATKTDTVTALGELYAHIANMPDNSKKRKLLKQCAKAGGVVSPTKENRRKRSKSVTESIKRMVCRSNKVFQPERVTTEIPTRTALSESVEIYRHMMSGSPELSKRKVLTSRAHIVDIRSIDGFGETNSSISLSPEVAKKVDCSNSRSYRATVRQAKGKEGLSSRFTSPVGTPFDQSVFMSPIDRSIRKAPPGLLANMLTPGSRTPVSISRTTSR